MKIKSLLESGKVFARDRRSEPKTKKVRSVNSLSSKPELPILVVNDDPAIQKLFRKKLEANGVASVRAMTGQKALYKARTEDFAGVFLDLVLPDMDGIELYEKLLESEAHYDLPVVFIVDTGSRDELEVFNRLSPEKPVTVISRSALKSRLDKMISDLVRSLN